MILTFLGYIFHFLWPPWILKVNSVQEAFVKCYVVHLLEFEILQTKWKNKTKNIKMLHLLVKNWILRVWYSLFQFLNVICKISNFDMWFVKHLAQASCTKLTLTGAYQTPTGKEMAILHHCALWDWSGCHLWFLLCLKTDADSCI